jgi:hypothetical protein
VLFSLQDALTEADVSVPASWRTLTDEREVPAGEAFERSAATPGLILVDQTPTLALFWRGDGALSAGVVVDGWTAVGFAYPAEFDGRVALLDAPMRRP